MMRPAGGSTRHNRVMSHAVEPADLAETAEAYGTTAYLLYSNDAGQARVNHVVVHEISREVVSLTGFGRGVKARIAEGEQVPLSLLWPATAESNFSLIADGTGSVDSDGQRLNITVRAAVLHRPAPLDGSTTC